MCEYLRKSIDKISQEINEEGYWNADTVQLEILDGLYTDELIGELDALTMEFKYETDSNKEQWSIYVLAAIREELRSRITYDDKLTD